MSISDENWKCNRTVIFIMFLMSNIYNTFYISNLCFHWIYVSKWNRLDAKRCEAFVQTIATRAVTMSISPTMHWKFSGENTATPTQRSSTSAYTAQDGDRIQVDQTTKSINEVPTVQILSVMGPVWQRRDQRQPDVASLWAA